MAALTSVDWKRLPRPEDDGSARHLTGMRLADVVLPSTDGSLVSLSTLEGRSVVFIYPLTGRPDTALPEGWDMIPGARGCTPQACSFRDLAGSFRDVGVRHLFGLSTQESAYQREAVERLHLPFPLLSDGELAFTTAHALPTFRADGMILLKRLTLIICDGTIEKSFYPIFPPDQNASNVLGWLKEKRR